MCPFVWNFVSHQSHGPSSEFRFLYHVPLWCHHLLFNRFLFSFCFEDKVSCIHKWPCPCYVAQVDLELLILLLLSWAPESQLCTTNKVHPHPHFPLSPWLSERLLCAKSAACSPTSLMPQTLGPSAHLMPALPHFSPLPTPGSSGSSLASLCLPNCSPVLRSSSRSPSVCKMNNPVAGRASTVPGSPGP